MAKKRWRDTRSCIRRVGLREARKLWRLLERKMGFDEEMLVEA
jgi:hypothetical protein